MIQGQNNPIRIRLGGDIIFENITTLSVLMHKASTELKHWTIDDVSFEGNCLYLPFTEKETMSFPIGLATVEVKALDQNGDTIFWKTKAVNIEARKDETRITDGKEGASSYDEAFGMGLQTEIIKGLNGETPIKGQDYWTEDDKAEIVNETKQAIGHPVYSVNNKIPDANGNVNVQGGSGGTSDYNDLEHKPSINGIQLVGDVKLEIPSPYDDTEIRAEIENKADKEDIPSPYDDTEVKEDIQSLTETKADKSEIPSPYDDTEIKNSKVGYSEVVGSQLFMYSNSSKENLLATLDLPMTDVQINGTSIVENGVANIPYGAQNVYGVVKPATSGDASYRQTFAQTYVMRLGDLDHFVRSALTDKKGQAYTETEQASARARLGINDWELIADITIDSDDVSAIEIDKDINGNAFNLKSAFIIFNASNTHTQTSINVGDTQALYSNFFSAASTTNIGVVELNSFGDYILASLKRNAIGTSYYIPSSLATENIVIERNSIPSIRLYSRASNYYVNGSRFKIYGVRA